MAVKKALLDQLGDDVATAPAPKPKAASSSAKDNLLAEMSDDEPAPQPAAEPLTPANSIDASGYPVTTKPGNTPKVATPMQAVVRKTDPITARKDLDFTMQALKQYVGMKEEDMAPEEGRTVKVTNPNRTSIYEADKTGTAIATTYKGNGAIAQHNLRMEGSTSKEDKAVITGLSPEQTDAGYSQAVQASENTISAQGQLQARESAKAEVQASRDYIGGFIGQYKDDLSNMLILNDRPQANTPAVNDGKPFSLQDALKGQDPGAPAGNGQPLISTLGSHMAQVSVVNQENFVNRLFNTNGDTRAMTQFVHGAFGVLDAKEQQEMQDVASKYPVGGTQGDFDNSANLDKLKVESAAIKQKYDQQRAELNNAVYSIAALKSVNRRIEDKGAFAVEKMDPMEIGMEIAGQLGGGIAVNRDLRTIQMGKKVDPDTKVAYELQGYRAMQYALMDQYGQDRQPLVKALADKVQGYQRKVLADNPEFERNQRIRALSGELYKTHSALFVGYEPTSEDIQQAAKDLNWDPSLIDDIKPADIQNPKVWYKRAAGSFISNSAGGMMKLLYRAAGKVNDAAGGNTDWEGLNKYLDHDWYENNDTPIIGGNTLMGGSPEGSGSFQEGMVVNTDPNTPDFLLNKANPNAGKFNWDARGMLNQVGEGIGMIASLGATTSALAKGASALGAGSSAAEKFGLTVSTFLGTHSDNYSESLRVFGDAPEDEGKRNMYALMKTASTALAMQVLPHTSFGKQMLSVESEGGKALASYLNRNGAEAVDRVAFSNIVTTGLKNLAADYGKAISIGNIDHVGGMIADAILAPKKYETTDYLEEQKQALITGAISMAVPTLVGGIGAFRQEGKFQKALMWEIGNNPWPVYDDILQKETDGKLDRRAANEKISIVTTMSNIVDRHTPEVSPTNGLELTPGQRMDYAHNMLQEAMLERQKKSTPDEVQHKAIDKRIGELKKERSNILDNAGTPAGKVIRSSQKPKGNETASQESTQEGTQVPSGQDRSGNQASQEGGLQENNVANEDVSGVQAADNPHGFVNEDEAGQPIDFETQKPEENATEEISQPQQEVAAEGNQPEHAHPGPGEQVAPQETPAQPDGGNSDQGGEGAKPEEVKPGDRSDRFVVGRKPDANDGAFVISENDGNFRINPITGKLEKEDLENGGWTSNLAFSDGLLRKAEKDGFLKAPIPETPAAVPETPAPAIPKPAIKYSEPAAPSDNTEGIPVWHGTPHNVEAFSTDHIGSGEGAQHFGWGLYFTSEKPVAEHYGTTLSSKKKFWEFLMNEGGDMHLSQEDYDFIHGELDDFGMFGTTASNSDLIEMKVGHETVESPSTYEALAEIFRKGWEKHLADDFGITPEQIDRLREIRNRIAPYDIIEARLHDGKNPSEYDYMRWDRPLTETQHGKIEAQAKSEGIELPYEGGDGKDVYDELTKKLGSAKEASAFLLRAGIDGNQYPIGSATNATKAKKNAEAGKFNYVVFNDKSVNIRREAATPEQVERTDNIEEDNLRMGEAEQRRKAGSYVKDGITYQRNPDIESPRGEVGSIQFAEGTDVPFTYQLMESDQVQPSHVNGRRNPNFFIPEAQPKNRTDNASKMASDRIGYKPELGKVGEAPNAYSGAPVVNARGEVIQGNNRAEGLKKHYKQSGTDYKQQLTDQAAKFGFTPEQVQSMSKPVLVRRIAVDDNTAIQYGNLDVKDTETGGKRRIDPVATARRIPMNEKRDILNMLLKGREDDTINALIRSNFKDVVNTLKKYLNPAQVDGLLDKNTGEMNPDGLQDIERLVTHFLFDKGDTQLPDFFEQLPDNGKKGLLKALPSIFGVSPENSLVPEVQNAILAQNDFATSSVPSFQDWSNQMDAFAASPKEIYTPLELNIAEKLTNAKRQVEVKNLFAKYAEAVAGTPGSMFEAAEAPMSKAEAVEKVFKVPYEQKATQTESDAGKTPSDKETISGGSTDEHGSSVAGEPGASGGDAGRIPGEAVGGGSSTELGNGEPRAGEPATAGADASVAVVENQWADEQLSPEERQVLRDHPQAGDMIRAGDEAIDGLSLGSEDAKLIADRVDRNLDEAGSLNHGELSKTAIEAAIHIDQEATPEKQAAQLQQYVLEDVKKDVNNGQTTSTDEHTAPVDGEGADGTRQSQDLPEITHEEGDLAGVNGEQQQQQEPNRAGAVENSSGEPGPVTPKFVKPEPTGNAYTDAVNEHNYYQHVVDAKERKIELMEEHGEAGTDAHKREMEALHAMSEKLSKAELALGQLERESLRQQRLAEGKQLAGKIRKAKLKNDGIALTSPVQIPVALYNAAIELVASAVEAGAYARDAIQQGIDYINARQHTRWDETKMRQILGEGQAIAPTADELRAKMDDGVRLSDANRKAADSLIADIKANRETLHTALNHIDGIRGISDGVKAKIKNYIRDMTHAEVYRGPGEAEAEQHLNNNGGDFAKALQDLTDDIQTQLLGAGSDHEKENIRKKEAAARSWLESKETAQRVADGGITPNYPQPADTTAKPGEFTLSEHDWKKAAQENFQNVTSRLEEAQREASKASGIPITPDMDAVTARALARGKAHYIIKEIQDYLGNKEYKKGSFFDRASKDGIDIRKLGIFQYAEHAQEANDAIAHKRQVIFDNRLKEVNDKLATEEDPAKAKKLQDEIANLMAQQDPNYVLMPDGGSGMSNEQARQIMQEFHREGVYDKYKGYSDEFRKNVVDKILDWKRDTGIISDDLYNLLRNKFEKYVPLKVDLDGESEDGRKGLYSNDAKDYGRDIFNRNGSMNHTYDTRNNPVLQSIHDLERSISSGIQNQANQKLANLIRSAPNDRIWRVSEAAYDLTQDAMGNTVRARETSKPDGSYVAFYENGAKKYIHLYDPGLAKLAKTISVPRVVRMMSGLTSVIRWTNTLANPDFIIKNPMMDIGDADISLMAEQNREIRKNYVKNAVKAPWIAMQLMGGRETNEYVQWREETAKHGGLITFGRPLELKESAEHALKIYESYGKAFSQAKIKHAARVISHFTGALEDVTRVMVFKSAIEAGETPDRAAMMSRNATIDFEKSGLYGTYINAFKAFANASIQGVTNLAYAAMKSKRVQRFLGFMVLSGIAEAALNDGVSDCGSDKKEDCWWQVPEFSKQRNFTVPTGHGHTPVSIPLPRQFAWFNYLGKNIYAAMMGHTTPAEFASNTLGSLLDFYNPTGGSQPLLQQITGNFSPLVGISQNANNYGGPIHPSDETKPDHENFWKTTGKGYIKASELLSELGGGKPGREGSILGIKTEISPNDLEYLVSSTTGGVYNTVKNLWGIGEDVASGQPTEHKHIPVLRVFHHESDLSITKQHYYEMADFSKKNIFNEDEQQKVEKYLDEMVKAGIIDEDGKDKKLNWIEGNQARLRSRYEKE